MAELTTDDVRAWDLSVIHQLFQAAQGIQAEHQKLGDSLANAHDRTNWKGEAGDAFRTELGKPRRDLEADGQESGGVAKAVQTAENDIKYCKDKMTELDESAGKYGWTITSDWRVDTTNANDTGKNQNPQSLQDEVNQLKTRAHTADHELALAVRAAVGDAVVDAQGHEVPGPQSGKTTPADQLPLPTPGGQTPSPTVATRDNGSPDPSRHLTDNAHPSPLLAGVSAAEWRQRLANFQPGDPLPDPRTPTGDKAIDALAFAAGQQNTTYAWGGNKRTDGPSQGQGDTGQGANQNHDWDRYGYDCGGLVRYAIQQGAGFDVGMGTDAIDTNPNFARGAGHVSSATLGNSVAGPGDVLVFGGSTPFAGGNTDHTGLYIGNGYFINAPQSGVPVQVDDLRLRADSADILKVPGQ